MKRVKLFFAVVALLLVTAGVFATKSSFFLTAPNVYYFYGPGSTAYALIDAGSVSGVLSYSTTPTTPYATITSNSGVSHTYTLYTYVTGSGYYPLNASGW